METFWLEQYDADLPTDNDWLSPEELSHLGSLRFAKRRSDWRLGRWTAKLAVASALHLPADDDALRNIVIKAAATGEPEVSIIGRPCAVAISISHRNGMASCAVSAGSSALGCDLELVEPKSTAFVKDYFTVGEQELIYGSDVDTQPLLASLLWSAKESALKALHVGLRADTRSVLVDVSKLRGVRLQSSNWHDLLVTQGEASEFHGWWRCLNGVVRTLVAKPWPAQPIELRVTPMRPKTTSPLENRHEGRFAKQSRTK